MPPLPPAIPADERERQRVEKRFLEIRNEYGSALDTRLRTNYRIWWSRKDEDGKTAVLRQADIDELREFGIIGGKLKKEKELPAQCSLGMFAEYLTEHYGKEHGKTYYKEEVKAWIKEGMPKLGQNKSVNTAPSLKWFEENKIGGTGGTAGGAAGENLLAKAAAAKNENVLIENRRLKRLEAEDLRRMDAFWMTKPAHHLWLDGFAVRAKQEQLTYNKNFLEAVKRAGKLASLDDAAVELLLTQLRPMVEAQFEGWQTSMAGHATELDKAAQELSEQQKAELKVKV